MEDNQSESYDEARLQELRKEVQMEKTQLLQLAYSEDLLASKIDELNVKGCQCTTQQLFYEALVYLSEAERVLQYAASCGRTIDRALIVTTLHNQAAVYQRIWQLARSADYIEAIIYNVSALLTSEAVFPLPIQITEPRSPQHLRFASYLTSKLSLISYHLQYCAVSSQIKNHAHALASAQKSLGLLKTYCEQLHAYEHMTKSSVSNDFDRTILVELQSIRDFQNQSAVQTERYIEKLMYKAKKSIVVFQKKIECGMEGLTPHQLKQLESFSLGQLMQIGPIALQKVQARLDIPVELTLLSKVYKAIYISIAHFTMATELRLIASDRYGIESGYRKQSKQFKQSQAHHLIAVITAALYVPCYTKYFQHILNSFKNHYQVDLSQLSGVTDDPDNDDLVHLEIQSVSNKDSDLTQTQKKTDQHSKHSESRTGYLPKEEFAKRSDRSTNDKITNRTAQEMNPFGSSSSSQNSKLRNLNKTGASEGEKSGRKTARDKSKREQKTREKKIIIVEKVVSKSRSKGKGSTHKRSKSRKSVHEQQEKVVHYFQYDNYSKKVVSKKVKTKPPSDLLTKGKPIRDRKSPQGIINAQLKKLNQISQSSKELINGEVQARVFKKCKSPEVNTSRSPNLNLKKK